MSVEGKLFFEIGFKIIDVEFFTLYVLRRWRRGTRRTDAKASWEAEFHRLLGSWNHAPSTYWCDSGGHRWTICSCPSSYFGTLILKTLALQLCSYNFSQSASHSFGYLLFYPPTLNHICSVLVCHHLLYLSQLSLALRALPPCCCNCCCLVFFAWESMCA